MFEQYTFYGGKRVVTVWGANHPFSNPANEIYQVGADYGDEEDWLEVFTRLLQQPRCSEIKGLWVGPWGWNDDHVNRVIEALVSANAQLSQLETLLFGDLATDGWHAGVRLGDFAPVFAAWPKLKHVLVRGGENLALGSLHSHHLESLALQSVGLEGSVLRELSRAELPNLTHLELALGAEDFGATWTIEDMAPLLTGAVFPKLHHLGLRMSSQTHEIIRHLATAPLMERIEVLDLSYGNLSDEGVEALGQYPWLGSLKKLDIRGHMASPEQIEQLLSTGIEVDASNSQYDDYADDDEYRYDVWRMNTFHE